MKKLSKLLLSAILIMSLVMMTGCGGGSSDDEDATKDDGTIYKIRVGYTVAETHASHIALRDVLKKDLEATGRFTVELYPNAQLGGDRQLTESTSLGTLEMSMVGEAVISGFVPEFETVGIPFLWTSIDAARNALDGDYGDMLNEKLLSQNIINLGWGEVGFRNITNSRGEIKTPADLKGLKIRTMENPLHIAYFKALGANPTPMGFNELFTALQQGTVDAQENPTALIYNSKFYEVQKYMSITEHVYTAAPILINKAFYEGLPEDLQKIVADEVTKTRDEQRRIISQQNADYQQAMADKGVTVTVLTKEEKEAFQAIGSESVNPLVVEKYGQEIIDIAQKYNK